MSETTALEQLTAEILVEFPDFKIVAKADSRLMRLVDRALKIITLGKMTTYMTYFITTMGVVVYVPDIWKKMTDQTKMVVLRHERVHMRQARRYGRLLFSLLYLFVPVPIGLAYFRMKFEREAYEESIRASIEYFGIAQVETSYGRHRTVRHFTSAEYFWMWPFHKSLNRWYQSRIDIEKGITDT